MKRIELWLKGPDYINLRLIYPNGLIQSSFVSWKLCNKKNRLQWQEKSCTSRSNKKLAKKAAKEYDKFIGAKSIFIGYI